MITKPIIVLGAGGHAKIVIDMLLLQGRAVMGLTDREEKKKNLALLGVKVLGTDDILRDFPPDSVELVNAIGTIIPMEVRRRLFQTYKDRGYHFPRVIHPSAIIAKDVQLDEGVQVMAGTIIQTGTSIGENSILNMRVSVDHDCTILAHIHVPPGALISAGSRVTKNLLAVKTKANL